MEGDMVRPLREHSSPLPTKSRRIPGSLPLLGILVAFFFGCAGRQVYRAAALPLEFRARPVPDIREVALPQLAASSTPSDVIMPGDLLEVTILTDVEPQSLPVSCRVDDNGDIQIPPIGKVSVAGLRFAEAESAIAQAAISRDVYRKPHITVTRTHMRTYRVTVTGAVQQPGVYEIPAAQADLMTALVQAGGLSPEAEPVAEIRRAARGPLPAPPTDGTDTSAEGRLTSWTDAATEPPSTLRIDLLSATQNPNLPNEYRLNDGDVVHVPQRKLDPIFVDGLVNKPGMYEFPQNQEVRLLDALALAGGRSNPLAEKVWIIRRIPGRSEPILIKANLRSAAKDPAENPQIAPGDVITVEETFGTFMYSLLKGFVHIGGSVPLF